VKVKLKEEREWNYKNMNRIVIELIIEKVEFRGSSEVG